MADDEASKQGTGAFGLGARIADAMDEARQRQEAMERDPWDGSAVPPSTATAGPPDGAAVLRAVKKASRTVVDSAGAAATQAASHVYDATGADGWHQLPDGGDWTHIKTAAANIARVRLGFRHDQVRDAVSNFSRQAVVDIETITVRTDESMTGLYSALADAVGSILSELVASSAGGKIVTETMKTFSQYIYAGLVEQKSAQTAAAYVESAKASLNQQVVNLARDTVALAHTAVAEASQELDGDLDLLFHSDPWWETYISSGKDDAVAGGIVDALGIDDPYVTDWTQHIEYRLWMEFTPTLVRAKQSVEWHQMSSGERIRWLDGFGGDWDAIRDAVTAFGEDPLSWYNMWVDWKQDGHYIDTGGR